MTSNAASRHHPFPRQAEWRDVLVIGGGASGVLFAANLLRQQTDLRVSVIEGRHLLGCGIAYSTNDPDHLLNTRVHNMSAFPDDEHHFLHWLQERGESDAEGRPYGRDSFVSRGIYGQYLSCLLSPWLESGRLVTIKAECLGLRVRQGGVKAQLDDGRELTGAYAVLATGHVLPRPDPSGLVGGAWEMGTIGDEAGPVVIIGTGLSMVDQVLSLQGQGYGGKIIALSRRGLLPRSHGLGTPMVYGREALPLGQPVGDILLWLRREIRAREAQGGSWRDVIDGIRPWVTAFWQAMDRKQRGRFLRHGASWWEVHRHRIPPASAARLEAAMASGKLTILRAGFMRAERGADGGILAVISRRDTGVQERLPAGRIIDCRGIRNDPEKNAAPLAAGLLAEGVGRIDPLRIGFDVTTEGQLIGRDGSPSTRVYALGPVSRATFWEITAIPDIRVQAGQMAATIAAQEAPVPDGALS